jgi:hypothetical protein
VQTAPTNIVDRLERLEKSLLGCLLEFCSRGSAKELDRVIASGLTTDQFATSDHLAIFRAMLELRNEGKIPDEPSLIDKLDGRVMAQVWDFTMGVIPENLECYVRDVREAWRDHCFSKQTEELANLTDPEDQLTRIIHECEEI